MVFQEFNCEIAIFKDLQVLNQVFWNNFIESEDFTIKSNFDRSDTGSFTGYFDTGFKLGHFFLFFCSVD